MVAGLAVVNSICAIKACLVIILMQICIIKMLYKAQMGVASEGLGLELTGGTRLGFN